MAKEPKQARDLTAKEAAFVREYLIDLNATQAAIRAGYSAKTANVQAVEIMARPLVKAAIGSAMAARSEETKIDAEWVLRRLAAEAEADVADIYEPDGALKPLKDWPKIWRQGLVAGMDVEEIEVEGVKVGLIRKVKISDRVRRLELIGKHVAVQAFLEKVEVAGVEQLADRIARAKAKAGGK